MPIKYTYEQFITAWQTSETLTEVGEKLGVSRQTVEITAGKLRKAGVELKPMVKQRAKIDVAALNKMIGEMDGAK